MVDLFLSEPSLDDDGESSSLNESLSFLQKFESVIQSVVTSGSRSEARLWLCTTISGVNSIVQHDQHQLFIDLLRSRSQKSAIAAQVLQMIFERRPQTAMPVITKRSYILEKFFEGNPRRIVEWFGNFAGAGESQHRKGAKALSHFAFVNRDICWDELEWKGKHGQSPAMVATKPHYFLDLDVLHTVENFLENVPDFWSSDELAESLKDGEILHLDMKFFIDQFVSLMYEEDSEDVWAVIDEFFVEEQFSILCQHLLILLDECGLHAFILSLGKFISRPKCKNFSSPSCWLESLLLTCADLVSIDELLLVNALINQRRQLLHLLNDDEHEDEKEKIEELMVSSTTMSGAGHWVLMKACTKMKQKDAMKWLGLQSWVLHYSLSKECKTSSSCELLFSRNGVHFRKSDDHSLIQLDGLSEGSKSDLDDEGYVRRRHKRKAQSRKRKRKQYYRQCDRSGDEVLDFEKLSGERGMQMGGASWFLSTDGFSCPWNIADLPDHLAGHCFSMWMKWVSSK